MTFIYIFLILYIMSFLHFCRPFIVWAFLFFLIQISIYFYFLYVKFLFFYLVVSAFCMSVYSVLSISWFCVSLVCIFFICCHQIIQPKHNMTSRSVRVNYHKKRWCSVKMYFGLTHTTNFWLNLAKTIPHTGHTDSLDVCG